MSCHYYQNGGNTMNNKKELHGIINYETGEVKGYLHIKEGQEVKLVDTKQVEAHKNRLEVKEALKTYGDYFHLRYIYQQPIFKEMIQTLMETDEDLIKLIESKKIRALSEEELARIVESIIAANPASVEDYKAGRDRAIKYLMGQIMKETKGSADPVLGNQILIDRLSKS